jgi:hypothetical protein
MSRAAIRLLILAMSATALAVTPMVTPAKAESSSKHIKKHKKIHRSPTYNDPWSASQVWPGSQPWRANQAWSNNRSSSAGVSCFRAFECAKWPPPFDEDPDRKASGTDQ